MKNVFTPDWEAAIFKTFIFLVILSFLTRADSLPIRFVASVTRRLGHDGREQAPARCLLQRLAQTSAGVCHQDHTDQAQESGGDDAHQPRLQRLHGVPVEVGGERPQCDSEPGVGERRLVPHRHPDRRRGGHGPVTGADQGKQAPVKGSKRGVSSLCPVCGGDSGLLHTEQLQEGSVTFLLFEVDDNTIIHV